MNFIRATGRNSELRRRRFFGAKRRGDARGKLDRQAPMRWADLRGLGEL